MQQERDDGRVETISGSGEATVTAIALLNELGEPVEVVDVGAPVTLQVKIAVHAAIPRLVIGYMIKDRLGQPISGTNTHHLEQPLQDLQEGDNATFRFRFDATLGPGSYSVAIALHSSDTHVIDNYEWRDLALVFNVGNMSRQSFVGNAWLPPDLVIERSPGGFVPA